MSERKIIHTPQAPAAIGPYSQAVVYNGIAYLSGQIPLDPATGQIVAGGIVEQTEQVMKNLGAVLEAAGSSFGKVLKMTIYLQDLGQFTTVNEIYGRYLTAEPPARATVQVAKLPREVMVEIDAIAAV